jgi:hypothetical protein
MEGIDDRLPVRVILVGLPLIDTDDEALPVHDHLLNLQGRVTIDADPLRVNLTMMAVPGVDEVFNFPLFF